MYSVVLMAALATSSSAPDFGHRCNGCYGGGYGGHGCHGYTTWCSCSGGWGCYGWGCYGATGHGCYSGWSGWGHGCYGATGWGCYGSWGGSPYVVCGGGPGAYGGYSCYGVPVPGAVGPAVGAPPVTPGGAPPEVTPIPKTKGGEQARAKVRIEVPADATLYVDGTLMKTGSAVRMFQTPALNPNMTYYYEVKAEINRGGQTFSDTQQLIVRPGETATASFAGLEQKAALATQAAPAATAQR
jgi:uncharacterized protein (TIGR03000 family)